MTTKSQISEMVRNGDLGALAEEGEPIGDCLAKMWRAWSGRDSDIEISGDLTERLSEALKELNAAYDPETGYTVDAPRANAATGPVCDAIDEIAAAIYAASERRDAEC